MLISGLKGLTSFCLHFYTIHKRSLFRFFFFFDTTEYFYNAIKHRVVSLDPFKYFISYSSKFKVVHECN